MQIVNRFFVFVLLLLFSITLKAQSNKSAFYFAIGTNLSYYSKSDIRLKSSARPAFDFTLYNVRGKDDGGLNFSHGAPQYSYTVGYYNLQQKWGIEYNSDHIKYYVRQWQRVRMVGTINNHNYDADTMVSPAFVYIEHSDGANYALLKFMKWKSLAGDKNSVNVLNLVFKAGAGPVIPKTNSVIMGKHRDDRYKLAGYAVALEGGLRYNFAKHLFAEANAKGAYASYSHFLIADGKGSQQWWGLHFAVLLGMQISGK